MLGCDITEVGRIEEACRKNGERFIRRILTEAEAEIFYKRGGSMEFLSGRFAAKESVSKSLKTGIGASVSFTDIEILNEENGAPYVKIKGERRDDIEISISHDRHYAMAVSLINGHNKGVME